MNDDKIYCPLSVMAPADCELMPCLREHCVWWMEDTQACAVLVQATAARKVSKNGR